MATAKHNESLLGGSPLAEEAARLLAPLYLLRRRLITRVVLSELTNIFLIALSMVLVTMFLDAAFRWRAPLPRWVGSVFVFIAVLASVGRTAVRRSWSFSLIGLCERLEELFPALYGKLRGAVSIALTPFGDPLAGSPQLQAKLLRGATHSLAQIDLANTLAGAAPRLRIRAVVLCFLVLAIWAIAAPEMAWQAARRLAAPWRLDPWPRLVVLELNAPAKVARGGDALIVVQSETAQLPSKTTLHIADDEGRVISQQMQRQEQRFVFTIAKMKSPLWLRAVGGDDDQMRWRRLEVVEPITLTATRLEAFPPAYAKLAPFRVGREMSVLEGTRLLMEFRASRPMKEATPVWIGRTLARLKIDSSGRIAKGEVTIIGSAGSSASNLRIDVLDREDAMAPVAWNGSIKVLRDLPPTIQWVTPRSATKIQPQSRFLLEATITDDIRLESLELRRRVVKIGGGGNPLEWQSVMAPPMESEAKEIPFSHQVDLGELHLTPGDAVEWILIAIDAKGQVKESEIFRCSVVDADELRKEVDRRLEQILTQLMDAARRQGEIASGLAKSERAEESRAARIATARAAQFDQRSLLEGFSSQRGGVLDAWKQFALEQDSHQFASGADQEQLEFVTNELTSITEQDLPAVLQELDRIQSADESLDIAQIDLSSAANLAQKASDRLSMVVDRLTHWRRWSRTSQTVEELLSAEQRLQEQTREVARKLTGRLPEELEGEESRLLNDLAARQLALARQLTELPTPPGALETPWRGAREAAGAQMSQAARDLRLNQLHQADVHQTQAIEAIRKLSQEASLGAEPEAERTDAAREPNAAAQGPRSGPTEAQLKEAIERQVVLQEKTRKALAALDKPGADKQALQAELTELAKAQAELASQVDSWQAKSEETPHE